VTLPETVCSTLQTLPDLPNSDVVVCPPKGGVGIHMVNNQRYYIQGSPTEIQASPHCNLISNSMTFLASVLSPISILPPPSSHCASISTRKNTVRVSKMLLYILYISPLLYFLVGRGSIVGIATRHARDGPGIETR